MNVASLRYLDEHLIREKEYWLKKLSGDLIITGVPLDHSRPATWQNGKAVIDIKLDSGAQSRLQSVCGGKDSLIFTVLVAVLKIVLHKYTGSEDIIVGTTVQRGYKELSSLNHVLALRDRVNGSLKIRDLLENVRQTVSESYANQKYSFKRLLELLNVESLINRAPLFDVMIVIDGIHNRENIHDLKQDLTLSFSSSGGGLSGVVEFSPSLFRRETIEVFVEHYKRALHAALSCPDIAISEIELLSPDRKQERIFGFNNTESDYPEDKTIHQLFQDVVSRTPGEVAVAFGASQLTYYELNSRANQLAHYLRKRGIGRGKFVGLFMDHSIEMIVGLLGILKAGGAYLPLDSAHPRTRLAFMLEDAQISLVLTQRRLVDRSPLHSGDTLCLDSDWELVAQESEQNPECDAVADDLAYLIYTSGSTGTPKGVRIQHRSLINYTWWAKDVYLQGERVTFPLYSSPAFDLTVTSIFTPLITGNRIVIYNREGKEVSLEEIIKDERIDIIKLTPSHLSLIKGKDNRQSRIKRLIVGGEALETGLARQAFESFGEGVEIFNEYGPTEATVGCMIYKFDPAKDDRAYVPIGRPAANVQIYVLDEDLQPVAENVFGELYISGDGLADGYLNCEDLTRERFIENPFLTNRRMYKTGDIARWLPDDVLEYVGRTDDQVKFHGYRVELNEIKCALNRHPQVRDSVIVVTKDSYGHDVMIAYYVSRRELAAAELRRFMAESVIEETLPNIFVHLAKMPLTLNGKVNYGALPDLNAARSRIKREYKAASTATEKLVAGIWSQVLRIEQVGVQDNFFDLGGHSLLATQVVSRVHEVFRVEMPLRALFEEPTVEGLGRKIEAAMKAGEKVGTAPLRRIPREGERTARAPLSFAQQRLWFLDQLEPGSAVYICPGAVRLEGLLDLDALERSVNEIVRRHEVLRTRIEVEEGQPVQVIEDWAPRSLEVEDLTGLSEEAKEEEVRKTLREEARTGFDLSKGPLIRMKALKLGQERHVMLFTMHHIACDGWSMGILIREVGDLYKAYSAGATSPLEELPIQYADFAAWQREWLQGEALEKELVYWRGQLAGMEDLELPIDHPRSAVQSRRGARRRFVVERELAERLKSLSSREGVTLFMTLMGAFGVVMSRYSGQQEVVVGTDIANRNRGEIEGLIGFFVNQLVIRMKVRETESFKELLGRVREVCLGAYAHQDLPFEKLVEELQPERDLSRSPLFQVKLILQNAPREELELEGLRLLGMGGEAVETAKIDLTVVITDEGHDLIGIVEYSRDLYEDETIERLIGHYTNTLRLLQEGAERPISELSLLSDQEREQILVEWNRSGRPYPEERRIHELIAERAERTPERIALVGDGELVSYRELNRRANQLGRYLQKLGVGPDVVVGLCLERSAEMVIAVMGAFKAGGAYLPLDPAYPLERLSYMLEDSGVGVVITTRALEPRLPAYWGQTVCLDMEWEHVSEESEDEPDSEAQGENLAYMIYTSGSTGRPKGVMICHSGLRNLVEAQKDAFGIDDRSRVLQFASFSFDASVSEIFCALAAGGSLRLRSRENLLPGDDLARVLREDRITTVTLPPTALAVMSEEDLPDLETVIAAGEACTSEIVDRWAAGRKFLNAYGPTEATVCASMGRCEAGSNGKPSIGRPMANTRLYILDSDLNPVPVGVRGELYISGVGLARGYRSRPDLTAERFVPNPFGSDVGERLYRTGDLARYLRDGRVEFIGRADDQVKLRGYRIELGEIEAALLQHEAIREAGVVARGIEDKRLIAYLVNRNGERVASREMREYLAQILPDYMIPNGYVWLEKMPVTSNGKLDRKALPETYEGVEARGKEYEAPRGLVEETLAGIWSEVLGVEKVSIHDNFFELGGHSILLTQVASRIRAAFSLDFPLRLLFDIPNLKQLAIAITAQQLIEADSTDTSDLLEELQRLSSEQIREMIESELNDDFTGLEL